MTQPAQRSASTGSGDTPTNPPAEAQQEPVAAPQPQSAAAAEQQPQQGQQGQPRQRDPNESVYTREDIMESSGFGDARPEILMGVLRWREQETGQPVTEFTKSDLEEWLPQFLGREV